VGATHGTTGEIDIDPKGVEQCMTMVFIRPLWGRNCFSVSNRGLHPRLFKFIPPGDGTPPKCLIQWQSTPALSSEESEELPSTSERSPIGGFFQPGYCELSLLGEGQGEEPTSDCIDAAKLT